MSAVIRHVVDSIVPASTAFADAARIRVAAANAPILEQLAARLAGAQHAMPRVARRTLVVCAGDHGAGDPGISLGASHPTIVAATAIADGTAALADVARAGRAPIVLIDAGVAEPAAMPASTIKLGRAPTHNLLRESAMTIVDATMGLEAGIALAMSLSEQGLDVLAVGALGVGSDVAAEALLAASAPSRNAAVVAPQLTGSDSDLDAARAVGAHHEDDGGLERLANLGGPETAVLAGLMLGAASIHVPIIIDGAATSAAALVAAALAPNVTGYLIAAHAAHPQILERLGLAPVFGVGLGHGEGIGAAMTLPLLDQIAAILADR